MVFVLSLLVRWGRRLYGGGGVDGVRVPCTGVCLPVESVLVHMQCSPLRTEVDILCMCLRLRALTSPLSRRAVRRGRQLPAQDAAGGAQRAGGARVLSEPVQRGVRWRLDHQARLVLPLRKAHVDAPELRRRRPGVRSAYLAIYRQRRRTGVQQRPLEPPGASRDVFIARAPNRTVVMWSDSESLPGCWAARARREGGSPVAGDIVGSRSPW